MRINLFLILIISGFLQSCIDVGRLHFRNKNLVGLSSGANGIFGQPSFSTRSTDLELGFNTSVRLGHYRGPGKKHIVVDSNNNRVLIWNSGLRSKNQKPDLVLGQPTFYTTKINYPFGVPTASSLSGPKSAFSDGDSLVVADYGNNRVLIWSTFPTENNAPADVVLGQADFISSGFNTPTISASTFYQPYNVHMTSGGRLYVADLSNHRVLFWNALPTVSSQPADGVLGQANFTSNSFNRGGVMNSGALYNPSSVGSSDDQLFIADRKNHRIVVWNTNTPASTAGADLVLGQSLLTTRIVNDNGLSEYSLYEPLFVEATDSKLIGTDYLNNRVLVWDLPITANFPAADVVIGEPDFTTVDDYLTNGLNATNMELPWGSYWDGEYLFIVANTRLMAFNGIPTAPTNGKAADFIYGQYDEWSELPNTIRPQSASSLRGPYKMYKTADYVWVNDNDNRRVFQWGPGKTPFNSLPDLVLGQTSFSETKSQITQSGFSIPRAVASDNQKLIVGDSHRILIWSTIPTTTNQPADIVIGQANFVSNAIAPAGSRSGSTVHTLTDIHITQDGKMIVADYGNHRVLIWNSIPTADNTPANLVLGQPNFTSAVINNGTISAASLYNPVCVYTYGTKLFVCDRTNNRVLVWNDFPTSNFQPADYVIGQPDFLTSSIQASNHGFRPTSVATNGKKFFINDNLNFRVMVWNTIPTTTGIGADSVIGQPNFDAIDAAVAPTAANFMQNLFLMLNGRDLWVGDYSGGRILLYKNADP